MKLIDGKPQWKGKPKASALDNDLEYIKLRNTILGGKMKPFEQKALIVSVSDGERLGSKHPERLVRDHLQRFIRSINAEADYSVTCRQTNVPGEWGVVVSYEPPNLAAVQNHRSGHAEKTRQAQ
jgi:hypothetical protein